MKFIKKLLGVWCALAMMLMASAPVLADETATGTGTITINNAKNGATYTLYEILSLESYNTTDNSYLYKPTEAWKNFVESNDIKGVYLDVDAQGYVTWHADENGQEANVSEFVKKAYAYATNPDNKIKASATATGAEGKATFTGLPLGYYMQGSTTGLLSR